VKPEEASNRIEASLVRLRVCQPFFGALALFIDYYIDDSISTACTNGKWIRFNPEFVCSITAKELDGVVIHELLHAALRHSSRRGSRAPMLWNVAADIVVNGIIREVSGIELPFQPVENRLLRDFEVEEVYKQLGNSSEIRLLPAEWHDLTFDEVGQCAGGGPTGEADQKAYWQAAFSRARMLAGKNEYGSVPARLLREVDQLLEAKLDWRTILWRFVARSPVDFEGYDRRFISSGLYLEDLQADILKVRVCIDTSGSIGQETLAQFLAELREIIAAYPRIDLHIYYADIELYGPYSIEEKGFRPQGGGGTDFRPFFNAMDEYQNRDALLIYFTDGHGRIPDRVIEHELIWVLETKSGLKATSDLQPCGSC
jgi:predicted metal-dependent peptidase